MTRPSVRLKPLNSGSGCTRTLTLLVMGACATLATAPSFAEESGGGFLPLPISSGGSSEAEETEPSPSAQPISEPSSGAASESSPANSNSKMEVYPAFEAEARGTVAKSKTEVPHLQDFDPVPEFQREPVIRRLKMIERLIREYGRAYDYRELTTNDLSAILQALDRKKSGKPQK